MVKITDVAMGMPAFSGDYVELKGNSGMRLAPLRWQAWETTVLVSLSIQNDPLGQRGGFVNNFLRVQQSLRA